jgi:branched-subunit amino acid ABC-type transport system permease component
MEYFLQIASNTIILASLYALLALGFNLLYSTNKFFDLSYAGYIVLGGYSYLTLIPLHLGIFLTCILAILVPVLLAVVLEKFLYSGLREKKSSSAIMMIASLGVLTVIQAIIAIIFTSNVQTLQATSETVTLYGVVLTYVQMGLIAAALIAYTLTYMFLGRTRLGVQLRAVADSEELAISAKLPVEKLRLITVIIGALLGAIAGILYGMDTSIDPYMGMSLLLKGAIVAIISGLGGITYGIVGALVLAILENSAIWYIGGEWKDAVAFLALIIILLWRPTGILKK